MDKQEKHDKLERPAKRPRRKFSDEFKRDAVEIVNTSGEPIAQVARELGIYDSTIGDWLLCRRRHITELPRVPSLIPRSRAT